MHHEKMKFKLKKLNAPSKRPREIKSAIGFDADNQFSWNPN